MKRFSPLRMVSRTLGWSWPVAGGGGAQHPAVEVHHEELREVGGLGQLGLQAAIADLRQVPGQGFGEGGQVFPLALRPVGEQAHAFRAWPLRVCTVAVRFSQNPVDC